jgi:hypothetical protein
MDDRIDDRNVLSQLEPWEFQYYAFNFNCTEEDLKIALKQVGNSPEDLKNRLVK